MSASPAPGDRPPLQGLRRSFTTPTRQLSVHEKAGLDKTDANADLLYTHPSARIFSFSPPTDSIRSSSKAEIPPDTDYPIDAVETLPWRSRTETLAASGILKIEKVRGSTNFLKCQDVMHAILRNSQCWCVDGESKFVLRVRQFKYYRIELPSTTDEDKAKVEELKKVLPAVLRFERTPCPFIRAFTVDLPDDAITPRRKGQWKRRDSSQPNISDSETPPVSRGKATRSWSMKSPPTSYPKNGPGYTPTFERGRPGSSAGAYIKDLSFDNYRNSSPASYAPSEDGSDSEHPESEHESEKESVTDRSNTASPQKEQDISHISDQTNDEQISEPLTNERSLPNAPVSSSGSSTEDSDEESEREKSVKGSEEVVADDDHSEVIDDTNKNDNKSHDEAIPGTADLPPVPNNKVEQVTLQDIEKADSSVNPYKDATPPVSNEQVSETTDAEAQHSTSSEQSSESSSVEGDDDSSGSERPQTSDGANTSTDVASNVIEKPVENHIVDEEESAESTSSENTTETAEVPMIQLSMENFDPMFIGELSARDELRDNFSANQDEGQRTPVASSAEGLPLSQDLLEGISSTDDTEKEEEDDDDDDTSSVVSSVDSFHTMTSVVHRSSVGSRRNGLTSESQFSNLERDPRHRRELSEMTITASNADESTSPEQDASSTHGQNRLQTPSLLQSSGSDAPESSEPSSSAQSPDGLRQRLKSRRSFSPLPPPSTIFTGNQIRHDSGSGHMTKAILQKVIVKPIEVVVLVVHILARIAGGATMNDLLSGELFKRPEHRRSVSGFADQLIDGQLDGSDAEDDFGVPIRGRRRSSERRLAMVFDDVDEHAGEDVD